MRVGIRKLGKAAIQEACVNRILENKLREVRKRDIDEALSKRSKRIEKEANQRSWAFEEVYRAKTGQLRARIVEKRKRKPKKLIIAIPLKKPD